MGENFQVFWKVVRKGSSDKGRKKVEDVSDML